MTPFIRIKTAKKQPLTPWELPVLLAPVHTYRRSRKEAGRDRPHFAPILAFIRRNRFAVASQVQRRFPESLRSNRTTRRHLEEMEALGYLGTAPTRSTSPLFPKVYYVTGRGVRRLQEAFAARGKSIHPSPVDRKGRHSREGYTAEQVLHEIFVTEFLLAVWQTVHGRPDLELLAMERRSLKKHRAFGIFLNGRTSQLEPDGMFLFRQKESGMVCNFLELDTGAMNLKNIKEKFRRYEAWARGETGQNYLQDMYRRHGASDPRPAFRVLVVADDRVGNAGYGRIIDLLGASVGFSATLRSRFWFAAVGDLRTYQHDSLPLAAPFWIRARESPPWDVMGAAENGQVKESPKHGARGKKAVLKEWLRSAPRHPLFPNPEGAPVEALSANRPGRAVVSGSVDAPHLYGLG